MPTISLTLPVAGNVVTAGLHATNYTSIQSAVNALDNNNVAVGAGILGSKLLGVLLGVRVLTGSGTYTPTSGTNRVYIECVGGGGGGGGCAATAAGQNSGGGGGGGGAYSASFLTTGFSGTAYAVGGGGNGGAAGNNNGNAGTDTTFGTTVIVAKGGGAGVGGATAAAASMLSAGGAGGASGSGTGDIKISGGAGTMSWVLAVGFVQSGIGGPGAVLGTPNLSQQVTTATGTAGVGFGGGGNGGIALASQSAQAGGNGAAGTIRIWEFP